MADKKNITTEQRKEERLKGMVYVFIIVILSVLLVSTIYNVVQTERSKEETSTQLETLTNLSVGVQESFKQAILPIELFSNSNEMIRILTHKTSTDFMNDIFYSITTRMTSYDQLRLIDPNGQELIRVNRNDDGIEIINTESLQDKSNRYYFTETAAIDPNELYVSPFDLNVENGLIEVPHKPMMRVGKAIYEENEFKGIIIINLLGDYFLNLLEQNTITHSETFYLLNSDGYYLVNPDKSITFNFMFEDQLDIGFFNDHPDVWDKIQNGQSIIKSTEGIYYHVTAQLATPVYASQVLEDYHYIFFVPSALVDENEKQIFNQFLAIGLIIIPILLILGWNLGVMRVKNKWFKIQLLEGATKDSLTGLYNHRMIISLISEYIVVSRMTSQPLTIVFVDINDLKKVNDLFGHAVGDQMIIEASYALTDAVRKVDPVSRLGGDEFLIALQNCTFDHAQSLMEQAKVQFQHSGLKHIDKFWSLSYGIATLRDEDDINALINRADTRMYSYKKKTK